MTDDLPVTIGDLRPEHWSEVARIHADGIATGNATFATAVPGWERWNRSHLQEHRFVALREGQIAGWAAVSAVSERSVYRGVVESSVYVDASTRGSRVGRRLLEHLIASTEAGGIWTIQAGIFPENTPSLRLHASVGFELVGRRKRLGRLHGVWRDVLLLERRSDAVN